MFGSSSRQFSSLYSSLSFKLVSLLLFHLFPLLRRLCVLQEYEYVHNAAMVGGSVLPVKFLLVSRESAIQRSYYAIQGQGRLAIGGDPVFCLVIRLPLQKEFKKPCFPHQFLSWRTSFHSGGRGRNRGVYPESRRQPHQRRRSFPQ